MRTIIILITIVLSISSCAQLSAQKRYKELQTAFLSARDICKQRYDSGFYTSFTERTECLNEATLRLSVEYEYPYMDLVALGNAYRMVLAKRIDNESLTETDASLLQAQMGTLITQEEQRRKAVSVQMYSQQQQAQAASAQSISTILQGMATFQQSLNPRARVTCIQTGNIVTCN